MLHNCSHVVTGAARVPPPTPARGTRGGSTPSSTRSKRPCHLARRRRRCSSAIAATARRCRRPSRCGDGRTSAPTTCRTSCGSPPRPRCTSSSVSSSAGRGPTATCVTAAAASSMRTLAASRLPLRGTSSPSAARKSCCAATRPGRRRARRPRHRVRPRHGHRLRGDVRIRRLLHPHRQWPRRAPVLHRDLGRAQQRARVPAPPAQPQARGRRELPDPAPVPLSLARRRLPPSGGSAPQLVCPDDRQRLVRILPSRETASRAGLVTHVRDNRAR